MDGCSKGVRVKGGRVKGGRESQCLGARARKSTGVCMRVRLQSRIELRVHAGRRRGDWRVCVCVCV